MSIDQHIGVYELLSVHATHLRADRRAAKILAFLMVSSVMRMMTRGFSLSFPVMVWVPADLVGVLTTNPYGLRPPWGLKMISASVSQHEGPFVTIGARVIGTVPIQARHSERPTAWVKASGTSDGHRVMRFGAFRVLRVKAFEGSFPEHQLHYCRGSECGV